MCNVCICLFEMAIHTRQVNSFHLVENILIHAPTMETNDVLIFILSKFSI